MSKITNDGLTPLNPVWHRKLYPYGNGGRQMVNQLMWLRTLGEEAFGRRNPNPSEKCE